MQNIVTKPHSIPFNIFSEYYLKDENLCLKSLITQLGLSKSERNSIGQRAQTIVTDMRATKSRLPLIDVFLQEYGLSTEEGVTLMRLSEALIRTPDRLTAFELIRDKLSPGEWSKHLKKSNSLLVNSATRGLGLTKTWIQKTGGVQAKNLAARLGDYALHTAISKAMSLMGDHFVLGHTIQAAMSRAEKYEMKDNTFSYDMLGEAAHTQADADTYFTAYLNAMKAIAAKQGKYASIAEAPSLSIKLSAIHPRYEFAQREACVPVLIDRILTLSRIAKSSNLGLTIDAEEADRLEISLIIFEALIKHDDLQNWDGLGLVVQAYQRRAVPVLSFLIDLARTHKRRIAIRLVKGAYWDSEIKRAQEMGLTSYPVYTRKENTDVSFLACAKQLLGAQDVVYSQFATHNAHTASAIIELAKDSQNYEFQRLHGMGEPLHEKLVELASVRSRIYAPVGRHEDLLPYLVRRLLENGANSSFVNQLSDPDIDIEDIVRDPIAVVGSNAAAANPAIISPCDQFSGRRLAAKGIDTTQAAQADRLAALAPLHKNFTAVSLVNNLVSNKPDKQAQSVTKIVNPAQLSQVIGSVKNSDTVVIDKAIDAALRSGWGTNFNAHERAQCLNRAADILEQEQDRFLNLCVLEAGKTWVDASAEVREAIDFCRYYALQLGQEDMMDREPLGVVACISPWNFPLAIFLGQIVGALATGNTVIAKPAAQTPLIAYAATQLLYKAGIPNDALHLVLGDGAVLGSHLTSRPDVAGICFTGSTATAKKIASNLVQTGRSLIPFIAETGGINAMIIDSTALLEQAVSDVIASAFQSAGQRCSACRLVCVQEDIAEDFTAMLSGAMRELVIGEPKDLKTDVGPVIDLEAKEMLTHYIEKMRKEHAVAGETPWPSQPLNGNFIAPIAFEIPAISVLEKETFGPVLHIVRFKAGGIHEVVNQINAMGYGLTMGLHTRLDDRVEEISALASVGNLYVNRNQIGAVVGVQPFGGEGLSGTGPKAGGPFYLRRLSQNKMQKSAVPMPVASFKIAQPSAESAALSTALKRAKQAALNLKDNAFQGKMASLLSSCKTSEFELDDAFCARFNTIVQHSISVTTLPGPTGETNSLSLHPRGVLACLGTLDGTLENQSGNIIAKQVLMALASGNAVYALNTPDNKTVLEKLLGLVIRTTGQDDVVQFASVDALGTLLQSGIDGVIVDGPNARTISDHLYRQDGPILPTLSTHDDLSRFFIERSLSVNITAAGGNATLLAL